MIWEFRAMSDGLNRSYEEHFACKRSDGRYVSTMAAFMARLRDMKPTLSLPEELTEDMLSSYLYSAPYIFQHTVLYKLKHLI